MDSKTMAVVVPKDAESDYDVSDGSGGMDSVSVTSFTNHTGRESKDSNQKNHPKGVTGGGGSEVAALVQKETWMVNGLRFLVLAVLVVAAVVSAYVVHHQFQQKEYDAFMEEYDAVSKRLVDLFRNDIVHKLWIGQGIASATKAMIEANQLQGPNITIPSFPELVRASLKLAPATSVKWAPLLMDEQAQQSFQAYVEATSGVEVLDDKDEDQQKENDPNRRQLQDAHISSPVWQVAPMFGEGANARLHDLGTDPMFQAALEAMIRIRGPVMTRVYELEDEVDEDESNDEDEAEEGEEEDKDHGRFRGRRNKRSRRLDSDSDDDEEETGDGKDRAMSMIFPVFAGGNVTDHELDHLVGSLVIDFAWSDFLTGYLLVEASAGERLDYEENIFDTDEVDIVLENSCGQIFTLKVDESSLKFVADEDLHETKFDDLVLATTFAEFGSDYRSFGPDDEADEEQPCLYRFLVYPTQELMDEHTSTQPLLFAFVVALIFVFTSTVFIVYDCTVSRRQRIITERAIKTNAIVASFFPDAVRDRMMMNAQEQGVLLKKIDQPNKGREHSAGYGDTNPIADFFPSCTILFADIAGFTAWSSEREPTQVFMLLERTFHDFDQAAKKLGVFKVETIGDCYVAVVGVPTVRKDHAVVCAKFAKTIVNQMKVICSDLEITLGPSTADLNIRVGIHSGSCTAGVLRGEKSRFQLFGDTMNTCSRMESSGKPGMIHVSETTAKLLVAAGKENWISLRDDTPEMKGKGKMTSYWLRAKDKSTEGTSSDGSEGQPAHSTTLALQTRGFTAGSEKVRRLVHWNVDILSKILKEIAASRAGSGKTLKSQSSMCGKNLLEKTGNMLEEVEDVLPLPQFDSKTSNSIVSPESITLPTEVVAQLTSFVGKIASFYHQENPFHNWEHAAHVTMSVSKLLSRIVRPTDLLSLTGKTEKSAADMHDHTFGITSSPLTQFSVVLSALIHDVDHPGVTNAVLASEKDPLAIKYKSRSVAEQNSVELTFQLLMDPEFKDLRTFIYTNDDEFNRFRNTIITLVLATDIMDKELGAQRKARWAKAFSGEETPATDDEEEGDQVHINRKATIVLEHLIQASDVAHTMQHWHVYKKWNEMLFREMYEAFKAGRLDKDPSESWYKGEIGFFDYYIIPLARKLETCGVFGPASHEYLAYAEENRQEWVIKGEALVKDYLSGIKEAPPAAKTKTIRTTAAIQTLEAPLLAPREQAAPRSEVAVPEIWC